MSRPRMPTAIQEAKGYFRQHPDRRRDGEPVVTEPLCAPHQGLPPDVLQAWQDISDQAPEGVLTRADSLLVEITARLLAEMRADFANFQSGKLAALHKALAHMGMTPTARAALSLPVTREVNPFDQF